MRKMLLFFLVPLLALVSSCSYDDSEVKDRLDDLDNKVTELEKQVKALNSDVVALRDLVSGKRFISDVVTNADGSYTITMVTAGGESSTITIKNGADGKSPALAVKKDTDGIYYWTLDGVWIMVDGKKLPASGTNGVTPEFKIENNNWYVSYDGKKTWVECGKASYDTSIFKSVTLSQDGRQAIIILTDGTKLTLDLYTGFGITFEKSLSQALRVGETAEIPFTLTGADDKTLIETIPSGEWKAVVERTGDKGVIKVTAPDNSQTGKIVVLVNDGGTKTIMRTLTFVAGILDVTTSSSEVPSGGGTFTAQVQTDLDFEVSIPQQAASWISLPQKTRGQVHTETVTLNVTANTKAEERKAEVALVCNGAVIETILVYQLPYYAPASVLVAKVEAQASLTNIIYMPVFGAVKATIDWGDGNTQSVDATISTAATMIQHTYAEPGVYYVKIDGSVEQFNGKLVKSANKPGIVEIIQWGQLGLTSVEQAFTGNTKLVKVAVPDQGAFAKVTTAEDMFYNCSALKEVPEALFNGATELTTVDGMFYGCTNLERVPELLFAGATKLASAANLFVNCKKLESIPAGLFRSNTALTDLSTAFKAMTIKTVPADLFKGLTELEYLSSGFAECASLESLPADLFKDQAKLTGISTLFKNCKALKDVPETLMVPLTGVVNMTSLFSGCSSLGNLPDGFFDHQVNATQCGYLFENCTKMTSFPSLKACVSLKTAHALWKGCTAMVTAPSDFFPESVSTGTTLAYMFQGCTSLKTVPAGLFDNFTGTNMIITDMFNGCTALQSLPVDIFDNVKSIKTASTTFSGCTAFTGESPYSTITVNGAPVKVHLYERGDYPDQFPIAVTTFKDCFKGCTKIADYANIPIPWGGISDGTKAAPTIKLTAGLTEGKEYFEVSALFKTTEVKSDNNWTIMTPEGLKEALEELNGEMKRVCTKYGITYKIDEANSEEGVSLDALTVDPDTEYIIVVMASNAHGTTFEQVKLKTQPMPIGEADFERYIGNWKVASTSSEVNKAPQTFNITITPFRVNESFKITGWGICTLSDDEEFALVMAYADGKVSIQSNDAIGLWYPYYVYPMCRFYRASDDKYLLWKPSTPLIKGSYDSAKNQISIWGEKFVDKEGDEYTVSGLDYVLYSGGKYYEAVNLLKPGYTMSDYSIGPYTLTKTASTSAVRTKAASVATPLQSAKSAMKGVAAPSGAYKVERK